MFVYKFFATYWYSRNLWWCMRQNFFEWKSRLLKSRTFVRIFSAFFHVSIWRITVFSNAIFLKYQRKIIQFQNPATSRKSRAESSVLPRQQNKKVNYSSFEILKCLKNEPNEQWDYFVATHLELFFGGGQMCENWLGPDWFDQKFRNDEDGWEFWSSWSSDIDSK